LHHFTCIFNALQFAPARRNNIFARHQHQGRKLIARIASQGGNYVVVIDFTKLRNFASVPILQFLFQLFSSDLTCCIFVVLFLTCKKFLKSFKKFDEAKQRKRCLKFNKNVAFIFPQSYPQVKHRSSVYFDEAVQYLDDHLPNFRLTDLAIDLNCSLQTIREIRKGRRVPDVEKVDVLYRKYGINPMHFHGMKPIVITTGSLMSNIASEPAAEYETKLKTCEKENRLLKQIISDKEEMINLLKHKK
jgi:hypothetical protein